MSILDLTIGAVEIGMFVASIVYGIVLSLVVKYLDLKFEDPLLFRCMVVFVGVVETFHTVCLWSFLYTLTVTDYGRPDLLLNVPWSFAGIVIASALMTLNVQLFLGNKVRILSGSLVIPIISWAGAVFHSTFAVVLTGLFVKSGTLVFLTTHQWMVIVDLTGHAAVDILLASAMAFYLLRRRSNFSGTKRVVDKLILYTLETGAITSIFSLSTLTCFLTMKTNYVYIGVFVVYPKMFSIVFITSLTSRHSLRQDLHKISMPSTHNSAPWRSVVGTQKTFERGIDDTSFVPEIERSPVTVSRASEKARKTMAPEVQITTEFHTAVSKDYESDGTQG